MEIRQLQTFVRLVEIGSFSRAAEELSLTQPAVTRQIGSLEAELKARLLDRLGRRASPTAAGKVLYEYASRIVRLGEEAKRAVADVAAGVAGRLAVGSSSTAATYILPPVLHRFSEAYPGVELSVHTGASARILELVTAGRVDVGVVMNLSVHPGIRATAVAEYDSVLVAYPGHPLARFAAAKGVPASALAEGEFIVMQKGSNLRGYVDGLLTEAGAVPRIAMELDNVEAIKKMIEARLGVSILPRLAVDAEVAAGTLAALPIAGAFETKRQVSAIYREDRHVSAALRAFLEMLRRGLDPTGQATRFSLAHPAGKGVGE